MLTENIELNGFWWLPGKENDKIAGMLKYAPGEGLRLTLIGSLTSAVGPAPSYPIVLGIVERNLVTLYDCLETRSSLSVPGFKVQELSPAIAFLGAHFEKPDDIRFNGAELSVSNLADWVGISGFKVDPGGKEYRLTYTLPTPVEAKLPNATVSIGFSSTRPLGAFREVILAESVFFQLEAEGELSIDVLDDSYVWPLQNFLTLATNKSNALESLVLKSEKHAVRLSNGQTSPVPIQALFRPFPNPPHTVRRRMYEDDFLFTWADIKEDFEEVIGSWLRASSELKNLLAVYFGVQYAASMYSEDQFLSVVQAIESYHRQRGNNELLSQTDHQVRISSILAGVPAEHKEWLSERLRYSNEPTLRQRLRELLDRSGPALSPLIRDQRSFINLVVQTRNYYVHLDPPLEKQAATGEKLYWTIQILSFLFKACLLNEMGFSSDRCAQLFQRNRQYQLVRAKQGMVF